MVHRRRRGREVQEQGRGLPPRVAVRREGARWRGGSGEVSRLSARWRVVRRCQVVAGRLGGCTSWGGPPGGCYLDAVVVEEQVDGGDVGQEAQIRHLWAQQVIRRSQRRWGRSHLEKVGV